MFLKCNHSWQRVPRPHILSRSPMLDTSLFWNLILTPPPCTANTTSFLPCFLWLSYDCATSNVLITQWFLLTDYGNNVFELWKPCCTVFTLRWKVYWRLYIDEMGFASTLSWYHPPTNQPTYTHTHTEITHRD